jgi:outer membrane murein-binding lipoprotein Lpp
MAYAPGWRVVMNEDVMAKLDVLTGMVQGLQADYRSLNESMNGLKESMNTQGERIARMEERLDEQSRILVALIPTQLAAVPRPAA